MNVSTLARLFDFSYCAISQVSTDRQDVRVKEDLLEVFLDSINCLSFENSYLENQRQDEGQRSII